MPHGASATPLIYDAIFTRATRLRFGAPETPASLAAAFAELRQAVVDTGTGGRDVETLTEVVWASLHGLTTLARTDRLRLGLDTDRIELLVAQFRDAGPQEA